MPPFRTREHERQAEETLARVCEDWSRIGMQELQRNPDTAKPLDQLTRLSTCSAAEKPQKRRRFSM